MQLTSFLAFVSAILRGALAVVALLDRQRFIKALLPLLDRHLPR
jgi:hypothetical protein